MIPLRDEDRPRILPWATVLTIAASAAVFGYQLTLTGPPAETFVATWALWPARLGDDPIPGSSLLTSAFLHAGWAHILVNMLFLWVFGPGIEERTGGLRFAALYLAFALAGSAAYVLTGADPSAPLVGASGAVSGVLGATLLTRPRATLRVAVLAAVVPVGVTRLPAAFLLAIWLLGQVAAVLTPVQAGHVSTVAWTAHLGGFAAGAIAGAWIAYRDGARPALFRGTG